MRIDRASALVAVLLAMAHLKKSDRPQSVKAIADVMSGQLSHQKINAHRDYLERYSVIIPPGRLYKGKRQGKTLSYTIYPRNLPQYVWEAKASPQTHDRWGEKIVSIGWGYKARKHVYRVDANGFRQNYRGHETHWSVILDLCNAIAHAYDPQFEVTDDWLSAQIDNQEIEFGQYPLILFQKVICSQERI